jgi:hypothetical protein
MAQPFLDRLEALVNRYLAEDPNLECKHFFSGAAIYAHGTICVSLSPVGLAFKLPEIMCADLIDSGAATPLRYFKKSPIKKGYALFSQYEELSDGDTAKYLRAAIAHTLDLGLPGG